MRQDQIVPSALHRLIVQRRVRLETIEAFFKLTRLEHAYKAYLENVGGKQGPSIKNKFDAALKVLNAIRASGEYVPEDIPLEEKEAVLKKYGWGDSSRNFPGLLSGPNYYEWAGIFGALRLDKRALEAAWAMAQTHGIFLRTVETRAALDVRGVDIPVERAHDTANETGRRWTF